MASVIELEVTAAAAEGQFNVRVVQPASDSTTTMQLDAKGYTDSRDDLETAVLASAVAGRRVLSPGEQRLRSVGQQLFDALFTGQVGETYRASATAAGARGERLQVVLRLDVPELAAIPWESMYDAQNDEYIGLADPLIRHIPSTDAEPLEIVPPLKVLVLVASPDGMTALDVEAERKKLSDALAEPIADGRIDLKWLMQASWEEVQDEMLSGTWHVLHFIGHGDYDPRTEQGVIALVGEGGGIHLVEADRLAGLLNEARPAPRLVVLNSCQSGRSGTRDLFSSTAATLVRRGISAVAAMQFSISDAGAAKFARGMYSALASGRSIGDAIGSGRVGLLSTPGSLEWVTPVLYVSGDTTKLFTITSAPPQLAVPSPQRSGGQTRTGFSKTMLAVIGGLAVAVVGGVAILLALVTSSEERPATSSTGSSTAAPTISTRPASTLGDPDTVIRALDEAGVDYTLPREQLVSYLSNPEFTPYPAVAAELMEVLGAHRLRQPVSIDVIVYNYEHSPGLPSPRRPEDVDLDVLKAAVAHGSNERYGTQNDDFESLLEPRG